MTGKVTRPVGKKEISSRSLEFVFRGRKYLVYSAAQLEMALHMTKAELIEKGVPAELVESKAKALLEENGHVTMDWIMSQATPEERKELADRYRYGGLWRLNP